jgi:peptidoglycan/xylan/chitin deacetylase (PgdA/CDA1 family)
MRALGLLRLAFEVVLVALVVGLLLRPPRVTAMWHESVIVSVPVKEKLVALTYDDGPHPAFTPDILAILDRYHVNATFFMIGQRMQQYPEIVKEVVARGHAIGNHTYSHPREIAGLTSAQVIRELDTCEELIERFTGRRTHLFRPPLGLMNSRVLMVAREEGYLTILWTVSADHHDAPTPQAMAERVLRGVKPGSIILAHDGTFPSRINDVEATPLIIEELQKRGYRFVTVPELLAAAREPEVPT